MTQFKDALWDDSDPEYAPGLMWRSNGYPIWRAPARYVKAGWAIKSHPLIKGSPGDEHEHLRALKCRELTREMLRWWDDQDANKPEPNTIKWLIGRYLTDEYSEYQGVKANTAQDYRNSLRYWEDVIGKAEISDLTYETIKGIEGTMKRNGRSQAFIHRHFTMLRSLVKHGSLIRAAGAKEVKETLSEIKFKGPKKRTVVATRDQVYAIAAEAEKAGYHSFAVGILLQFEFALRAVDIRGQWLDAPNTDGGIRRNGKRWQDGLTWDMFDEDFTAFEKVISKTEKTLDEAYHFSLEFLPELRQKILALAPPEARVGPVILSSRRGKGLPYTRYGWSQAWARFRKAAGVPEDVQARDMRAGAISEADMLGVSREMLSQAAQHSNLDTTARYVRNRSKAVANVVELRQSKNRS